MMKLGLDHIADHLRAKWKGARVGLLCHAASVTSDGRHARNILASSGEWKLTTLFGPEHGASTSAQDMEPVPPLPRRRTSANNTGPTAAIPTFSLYGATFDSLSPTPRMLADVDVLVVDLQDIGTRYYTYIWTTALCLRACARVGKPVIVCDRPNPINGVTVEGPTIEPGFESFVGLYPIPVRHAMTIGEVAQHVNTKHGIDAQLEIVQMDGWRREWYWDETGLPWVNPSPNMRSLSAATLYPGLCLLEATNISEGRGTSTPFELCGAPWIDGKDLARKLCQTDIGGIGIEAIEFTPLARKYADKKCGGVRFTITDREKFRPYEFGLTLLRTLATFKGFRWRDPSGYPPDDGPYEFVTDRPAIDLLTGSPAVRREIDGVVTPPSPSYPKRGIR